MHSSRFPLILFLLLYFCLSPMRIAGQQDDFDNIVYSFHFFCFPCFPRFILSFDSMTVPT
ncbi:uncharacterized protein BJX67DRAFT_364563 [Aspergillus lucknowensis]|uniref:Uncharacterized protein n=1 Tax=Aspergillus lucknowensis TaxID=176173 RepID=A0ABR4LI81_9EURO